MSLNVRGSTYRRSPLRSLDSFPVTYKKPTRGRRTLQAIDKKQEVLHDGLSNGRTTARRATTETHSDESSKFGSVNGHSDDQDNGYGSRESPLSDSGTPLKNLMQGTDDVDTLHLSQQGAIQCSARRCLGSVMSNDKMKHPNKPRSRDEVISQAKEFMDQYFTSIKRFNSDSHKERIDDVITCIQRTGTYDLTYEELSYGAKTAWRNAGRCIGRIQWSKLEVFDARHVTTAKQMFEVICHHLEYATNGGNLRSAISIFPKRTDDKHDYRVWNKLFIQYAGYRQPDGSVIGDPATVEFTEVCESLGWNGPGGRFDILPVVLSANGNDPEIFELPPELALEVKLSHPKYDWFADLGLQWFAVPGVSNMLFDCGGIEFSGSSFSGWYMGTEVGARDLCDVSRYNITEMVAKKMNLNTLNNSSLWRDQALVEVNIAVLHSFHSAGVTIVDHHSASESFITHLENEHKSRGGCPADWVWLVPPMSGSLTEVFHQEMLMYTLKPSYDYQEDAWKTHTWQDEGHKMQFYRMARRKSSIKLNINMLNKCLILYATETGRSERFAKRLAKILKGSFLVTIKCMDEYDVDNLYNESLVLIVASTFGNGNAPDNGKQFAKDLERISQEANSKKNKNNNNNNTNNKKSSRRNSRMADFGYEMEANSLRDVSFGVFALGSSSYPNFCEFGHHMEKLLSDMEGKKIVDTGEGDELSGQEEAFKAWAQEVLKASCDEFSISNTNVSAMEKHSSSVEDTWTPSSYRVSPVRDGVETDLCTGLSMLHKKTVSPLELIEKKQLQSQLSPRQTILTCMDTGERNEIQYQPGDHLGIFPANSVELVLAVLSRLHKAPHFDDLVQVESMQEASHGSGNSWTKLDRLPLCTLRTALTNYLDLTTPPTQEFLKLLVTCANSQQDKDGLRLLFEDSPAYNSWKLDNSPTLLEVLEEFSSLKVPSSLLLTQLPLLQQRYYSISSSPGAYPGEVHATVAILRYRTRDGMGPVHEGVCSNWLNRCQEGDIIPCFVRSAPHFRLPEDKTVPVLMIGPGTGIAAFRSFWQQREVDMDTFPDPDNGDKHGWGDMDLYFGCRASREDNIFGRELAEYKRRGILNDYHIAMSREPGIPKTYVQDLLVNHARRVYSTVWTDGGHVYVCGDVKMADDIRQVLERIFTQEGGMTFEEAKSFIASLKTANRYHEDIFGSGLPQSTSQRKSRRSTIGKPLARNLQLSGYPGNEQVPNRRGGRPEVSSRNVGLSPRRRVDGNISHRSGASTTTSRLHMP